jgi:hypothetical protein
MQKVGGQLIQAVEWKKGTVGTAGMQFKKVSLIHCVEDGDVTAHFTTGDETRSFKITDPDRILANVDITIVSGSFEVN